MATYIIVSSLCCFALFFYNIKKRFTVKFTYLLLFLSTYSLLVYYMHEDSSFNIYFGIMMAFPAMFVSLMFTDAISEPISAFHDGITTVFELLLEYKLYASIIIAVLIIILFFLNQQIIL